MLYPTCLHLGYHVAFQQRSLTMTKPQIQFLPTTRGTNTKKTTTTIPNLLSLRHRRYVYKALPYLIFRGFIEIYLYLPR